MARIAENTVIVDGQEYKPGDVIPDFKSIKCVDTREPRKYQGLSADVSVLNDVIAKYASGGASCFMSDTGEYYEYDRKEKAWKLITNITERGFDSEKAYGALKHMLKNVTVSDEKIQSAVTNYLTVNPVLPGATTEQAQQIEQNRTDVASLKKETGSLKEDIGNKAPAIIKKASGKTIIINDSSNLPIKILSGTGKIIITGKNILDIKKRAEFTLFEAKAGTLFTLITNGELSEGGNIKFIGENNEDVWFAIDKGKTKASAKIDANVKGYVNLLVPKEGLKYCFSVGENDEYEEYVEQVITAPVDSEQLKVIHTNYPTTILTSENKISVEYVADTEAYIEKRIKEENQSLQKQILEIQNALISQKI